MNRLFTPLDRLLKHRPARTHAALPKSNRAPLVSGYELQRALAEAGRVAGFFEAGAGPLIGAAVRAAAHRDAALLLVAPPLGAEVRGPGAAARADAAWLRAAAEAADLCGLGSPLALFGTAESEGRAFALLEAGYTGVACRAAEAAEAAACLRPARDSEMGTLFIPTAPAGEDAPDALSGTLVELSRAGALPDWVAVPGGAIWVEVVKPSLPVVRLGGAERPLPEAMPAGAYDLTSFAAARGGGERSDELREAFMWEAICEGLDAIGASKGGHAAGHALVKLWAE